MLWRERGASAAAEVAAVVYLAVLGVQQPEAFLSAPASTTA